MQPLEQEVPEVEIGREMEISRKILFAMGMIGCQL